MTTAAPAPSTSMTHTLPKYRPTRRAARLCTHAVTAAVALCLAACSPKAEFADSLTLDRADEVRVVASSESVVPFCESVRERIAATDYYVSPCERDGNIDFATAKAVLARLPGWSLSVQIHKILGFR